MGALLYSLVRKISTRNYQMFGEIAQSAGLKLGESKQKEVLFESMIFTLWIASKTLTKEKHVLDMLHREFYQEWGKWITGNTTEEEGVFLQEMLHERYSGNIF